MHNFNFIQKNKSVCIFINTACCPLQMLQRVVKDNFNNFFNQYCLHTAFYKCCRELYRITLILSIILSLFFYQWMFLISYCRGIYNVDSSYSHTEIFSIHTQGYSVHTQGLSVHALGFSVHIQ